MFVTLLSSFVKTRDQLADAFHMVGSTSNVSRCDELRFTVAKVTLFRRSVTIACPVVTITVACVTKETPSGSGLVNVTASRFRAPREIFCGASEKREAAREGVKIG